MSTTPARRSPLALLTGVAVAGGLGWLVDATLLWVLATRLGVPAPVAAAIGFLASGVVNFVVNRLVFHGRGGSSGRHLQRYAVLFLANLAVVSTAVPALGHLLETLGAERGVGLLLAKVVMTAAMLPVNAFAYHRWVFVPVPE